MSSLPPVVDDSNNYSSPSPWGSSNPWGNNFGGGFGSGFGGGMGNFAAGIGDLFAGNSLSTNWPNPANGAMNYLQQIPGTITPYYQPYMNAGQGAMGNLQQQLAQLTNNPGAVLNGLTSGYQQSPGYQFAMNQAQQGASNQAAAGGMAGSPQSQQFGAQIASNMANQDFGNYRNLVTQLFGQGMAGEQGMMQQGFNASTGLAGNLANILAGQANLSYAGQADQNQLDSSTQGAQGQLFGAGLGALASFFL